MPDRRAHNTASWLAIERRFRAGRRARALFREHVRVLARLSHGSLAADGQIQIERARRTGLQSALALRSEEREKLVAAMHVVTDLVAQGWGIRNVRGTVKVRRPDRQDNPLEEKKRVRLQLLAER